MRQKRFLTARWDNLIMMNYEVDPKVLQKHLPPFTELDLWEGKALVSVVGFLFADTKVWGIKWPFHVNFEEVNLRFYVRHFDGKEWKRGAVFISEIVPKRIIPVIANTIYNEHYIAMPMRHSIKVESDRLTKYVYGWKFKGEWAEIAVTVDCDYTEMLPNGPEQFIFEHYWGYNKLNDLQTLEYAVEHPSWQVAKVVDYKLTMDVSATYGEDFVPYLSKQPFSVFFAKGSEVVVRVAGKITGPAVRGV
ncbi:YqjF family protein [Mucilaginibacter ginkgonis]|uniref:DUF2071 domain-containing protein n=1 Tax=Mucilaginibacter ginkgonis TaxID=2682091 RepID=A0A6I4I5I9_9SPHI|nr:DUF2071 domain-containing protein [Mucilaginibacter ginkgonis]QQL48453.1 DUF2071 domain-containing protein [Mucilaginibacter ginkgonis]